MKNPSHDPLQKWPRVFISYAREDGEAFATKLRKRLERQEPEITLWQDRAEMKGGVGWRVQIEEALDKVMFTVMLMTSAALRSEVCQWEWRYARQRGVVVCPVMSDLSVTRAPDFKALPQWMRKVHWYNLEHEWETFCLYLKSPPHVRRAPFMAPDLPAHFVARPLEFDRLIDLLLDRGAGNPVAVSTTLLGAGGYGKTTLAAALCRDERMVEVYDDGILWATLGQTPNLLGELGKLHEACSGERAEFADVGEASRKLAEKLDSRNCLLVIELMFRWLIFRIMLEAGLIKIRGDSCWRDLTALYYHFETQPLPNPLSRWFHFLPRALLRGGVVFNHVAELVAPWFVFGPRMARRAAGGVIVLFQGTLILSGNLSFLNWLTIVPALACFDDAVWAKILPRALIRHAEAAAATRERSVILGSIGRRTFRGNREI